MYQLELSRLGYLHEFRQVAQMAAGDQDLIRIYPFTSVVP